MKASPRQQRHPLGSGSDESWPDGLLKPSSLDIREITLEILIQSNNHVEEIPTSSGTRKM